MEVQMKIIAFLLILTISAATDEVLKKLAGTVGGSITLPLPVADLGFCLVGTMNIAMVQAGKIQILVGKYENRVLWDNNTGLFTITGLQRNDSGTYTVDSKTGLPAEASYTLAVYESVPSPAVKTLSLSSESCTLECVLESTEDTTLYWFKDEDIVNQSSSALSLPLTVHKEDFTSSFRCVAANPSENKTRSVDITTTCSGQVDTDSRSDTETRNHVIGIVIPILSAVIIVFAACFIKWKYFDNYRRTTRNTQGAEADVVYTDIHVMDRGNQGGGFPSQPVDRSNLTTVYDKLEVHRMSPDDTDTSDRV